MKKITAKVITVSSQLLVVSLFLFIVFYSKDNSENINEAISGLMVLGYSKKDIEKAFEHLDIDNLSIEDLIKKGLILLSQK